MKLELCYFSGYKIHPGHGRRLVRVDGKVINFIFGKTKNSYMMRRNPRETAWTIHYRRKHKKGAQGSEMVKRRTRRTVKSQKAITGASLNEILMKRNQKPEVRKAQREQAIRAAKEKAREKKDKQKVQKFQQKAQQKQNVKQAKNVKGTKGGKRF